MKTQCDNCGEWFWRLHPTDKGNFCAGCIYLRADEAAAKRHDEQEAEAEAEDAEADANCRSCGAGIGDGERYCQDCSDDHAESERERLWDLREGKQ